MTVEDLEMLNFCLANTFDPNRSGTTITGISADDFTDKLNQLASLDLGVVEDSTDYPGICCHLFVRNDFTTTRQGVVAITSDLRSLVVAEMVTRGGQEEVEEPYEAYSISSEAVDVPQAEWLDVVLYTQEHLKTEGIAIDGQWGIVTILGVPTCGQTPPKRSTLERNADIATGGNGIVASASMLAESDAYWYPTGPWVNVK